MTASIDKVLSERCHFWPDWKLQAARWAHAQFGWLPALGDMEDYLPAFWGYRQGHERGPFASARVMLLEVANEIFDHPICFRDPARRGWLSGVISFPYSSADAINKAREHVERRFLVKVEFDRVPSMYPASGTTPLLTTRQDVPRPTRDRLVWFETPRHMESFVHTEQYKREWHRGG